MPLMETKKWQLNAPNIVAMKVKIVGTTPLIFHKWSEKAKRMILDKQQKKANKGREIRDPDREYNESFYFNSEANVAFPALSIKQAMVNSARNVEGLPMTLLRGCVFVKGDEDGMIELQYKGKTISDKEAKAQKNGAEMREDMVRIGMGTADLRYRGQISIGWSMDLLIQFNADVISTEQVLNLLQIAGFSSGLGEWRPERNGDFGTFEVQKTSAKPTK